MRRTEALREAMMYWSWMKLSVETLNLAGIAGSLGYNIFSCTGLYSDTINALFSPVQYKFNYLTTYTQGNSHSLEELWTP